MRPRRDRKHNVPAIELSARKKIERGREHAHPCRDGHGIQIQLAHRHQANSRPVSDDNKKFLREIKNQRVTKPNVGRRRAQRSHMRAAERKNQHRHGHHESRDWTSDSYVEQNGSRSQRRANSYERSQSSNQSWKGNKEG